MDVISIQEQQEMIEVKLIPCLDLFTVPALSSLKVLDRFISFF